MRPPRSEPRAAAAPTAAAPKAATPGTACAGREGRPIREGRTIPQDAAEGVGYRGSSMRRGLSQNNMRGSSSRTASPAAGPAKRAGSCGPVASRLPPPRSTSSRAPRASAAGMAYARGAQQLRARKAVDVNAPLHERFFGLVELVVRAVKLNKLLDVCALRGASRQLCEICSEDEVWDKLYHWKWDANQAQDGPPPPRACSSGGWRQAFLARLRRSQAGFLARTLPSMIRQRARRKDGFPDLRKLHDALRLRYTLSIGSSRDKHPSRLEFSADACQTFESAICFRCSFSSLRIQVPLHLDLVARSSALGREASLLLTKLEHVGSWGEDFAVDEQFRYLRSPSGQLLLVIWRSDSTLAGLFITLHYSSVFSPLLAKAEAWEILAGRPAPDDLDSCLGLHDYTMLLTLRSARLESFSNCFYKVAAFKLSSNKSDAFGRAVVQSCCCLEQRTETSAQMSQGRTGSRPPQNNSAVGHKEQRYCAEVSHFEVLAPHESGSQPPFPCHRQPNLAFQTSAFKSVLPDHLFVDVTIFDEHGHMFWSISAVAHQTDVACPHESSLLQQRFVEVDFDRGGPAFGDEAHDNKEKQVRWICLAERGAAHLVVQLEYGGRWAGISGSASEEGQRPLPRVNSISWHPELQFLDDWWGSKYTQREAGHR